MPRDNLQVLNAIMVVVNECLRALDIPQLDRRQRALLICILAGMARHAGPLQTPFNMRLVRALRMEAGAERQRALRAVLGLRSELPTMQPGSILAQDRVQ